MTTSTSPPRDGLVGSSAAEALKLAPAEFAEGCESENDGRGIRLWDAVSIIVGIVIGAGIYETAPMVFANVQTPLGALGIWAVGGALSLIGACCYAELASTYPRSGGDYVYLNRAFGRGAGFLFAWSQLAVILTGSIGMMAYVFADYAAATWGFEGGEVALLASAAVVVLTLVNLSSLKAGRTTQNVLSGFKVIGLLAIVVAGFVWGQNRSALVTPAPASGGATSLGLALILVLYTYGGWNDAAFVAADVREPRKNLPRALLLGTAIITLVYLLVNAAFIAALGFDNARTSRAIASDVLEAPFGGRAATAIAVLVMASALGAVNGLIFTGSRVHASLGADYSALAFLGQKRSRAPSGALTAQCVVSLLLIALCGTTTGRSLIDGLLTRTGFAPADWVGHGGFDTLLRCSAPVFWMFFLLTSISLFVLRFRDPERPRPFRVPLYPVVPLLFSGMCLYMLYSAVEYAGQLTLLGVVLALSGVPFWFASKRRPSVSND